MHQLEERTQHVPSQGLENPAREVCNFDLLTEVCLTFGMPMITEASDVCEGIAMFNLLKARVALS